MNFRVFFLHQNKLIVFHELFSLTYVCGIATHICSVDEEYRGGLCAVSTGFFLFHLSSWFVLLDVLHNEGCLQKFPGQSVHNRNFCTNAFSPVEKHTYTGWLWWEEFQVRH